MIAWIDGRWVPLTEGGGPQVLSELLQGRTGPGVFETLRAVGGELPLWDRHLERLRSAAERFGIPCAVPESLRTRARQTLERNDLTDAVLRLTLMPVRPAGGRWILVPRPLVPRSGPVRLVPVRDPRPEHGPPQDVKCTVREAYDVAQDQAAARGGDDALLIDDEEQVLETAIGNVFFCRGGRWHTPAADGRILPGVARAVLLEALEAAGSPATEGHWTLDEVQEAEGLVVTNAVHGPRPAVLEDGPGPAGEAPSLAPFWRPWPLD